MWVDVEAVPARRVEVAREGSDAVRLTVHDPSLPERPYLLDFGREDWVRLCAAVSWDDEPGSVGPLPNNCTCVVCREFWRGKGANGE